MGYGKRVYQRIRGFRPWKQNRQREGDGRGETAETEKWIIAAFSVQNFPFFSLYNTV